MTHVYDVLAPVLGVSSAVVLLLLVIFLLRGPARQFWVVLLYVSWELLATAGLTIADLILNGTEQVGRPTDANHLYARIYWTNDVMVDLLRFVLAMVLIYQVVGTSRPKLGRVLTGLVLVMIALPFILFHPTFQPYPKAVWFNSTSQLLNFGAAVMNVILWGGADPIEEAQSSDSCVEHRVGDSGDGHSDFLWTEALCPRRRVHCGVQSVPQPGATGRMADLVPGFLANVETGGIG